MRIRYLKICSVLALFGCDGSIGEASTEPGTGGTVGSGGTPAPVCGRSVCGATGELAAATAFPRLTHSQWENSVRDLLRPESVTFEPTIEWHWEGWSLDGNPDVVSISAGNARALNGVDGMVVFGPVPIQGGGVGGAPTVADFEGDGNAEVVYNDECHLYILSGEGVFNAPDLSVAGLSVNTSSCPTVRCSDSSRRRCPYFRAKPRPSCGSSFRSPGILGPGIST